MAAKAIKAARSARTGGPEIRAAAETSAKGKELLLLAGSKKPSSSGADFAAEMKRQAALAEQAKADRKRQIVKTLIAARSALLEVIEEVTESRDQAKLEEAIEVAKEAGLEKDSQTVLIAHDLVQEIKKEQYARKKEAAELAAQHNAVHTLTNREMSQLTTVYNSFKGKNTGTVPGFHLKTLFLASGVKVKTGAVRMMLKKLKKLSTDQVTLKEFVFLAARLVKGRGWSNEIEGKFEVMAEPTVLKGKVSEDKFITFRELKVLNKEFKRGHSDADLELMIEIADANNDDRVDKGEFYALLNTGRQLTMMLQADNRRAYEELKEIRVTKAHRMLSEVYKETLESMDREKLTQALRKAFEAGMDAENELVVNVKQYIKDLIQIEKY